MNKYHIDVNALLMSSFSETNLRGCGYQMREYYPEGGAYVPIIAYLPAPDDPEQLFRSIPSSRYD